MRTTGKLTGNTEIYASLGIFFIFAFLFFCSLGNYILYFQETQHLFVFSGDYLGQYLIKPGGILELISRFLTQFYAGRIPGSLIVSVMLTLPGLITLKIFRNNFPGRPVTPLMVLIPSFILLLMQANYFHLMEHNTGFVLASLFFLGFLYLPEKKRHLVAMITFPLLYYIAGSFIMIFAGMYIVHTLMFEKGKKGFIYILLLVFIAVAVYFLSLKQVFLQPAGHLLWFPFPVLEDPWYSVAFILLSAWFVFYSLTGRFVSGLKARFFRNRNWNMGTLAAVSALTIFLLFKVYNPQTARIVELERRVFAGKFSAAVSYHEKHPVRNLIGVYYYNYALSEEGLLCDRLFNTSQDFGFNSLILPWGDAHLDRGAWFYYSIGLMNEAHRWAYEEMIVYGARPQNILMLARTSLINGDYRMAERYTGILRKTLYYRGEAKRMEKLSGNPELIAADPLLGERQKMIPDSTFFIQFNIPQNNLPVMIASDPYNKKAFEYYLAGLLLNKDIEIVVGEMKRMKEMGYTRIPRHLEEAIWIYYDGKGFLPDLGGLPLSVEIRNDFQDYFSAFVKARQNQATLQETMRKSYGNTYWYYYHFK